MKSIIGNMHARRYVFLSVAGASLTALAGVFWTDSALTAQDGARNGTPSAPYANMPAIAPIGVRVDKYLMFQTSRRDRTSILRRATGRRRSAPVCT